MILRKGATISKYTLFCVFENLFGLSQIFKLVRNKENLIDKYIFAFGIIEIRKWR